MKKIVYYHESKKKKTYNDIKQEFSFGTVQDFHQVADAFLPDVKSMLSGWSGAHVLPISRETALFPHGSVNRNSNSNSVLGRENQ